MPSMFSFFSKKDEAKTDKPARKNSGGFFSSKKSKAQKEADLHVDKSKAVLEGTMKTREDVLKVCAEYPTPFHLYDEAMIRQQCANMRNCFTKFSPKYINYFAVKATPTPAILKIMKEEGFGADCSSLSELLLSEKCGFKGEEIMFTSNNTPAKEYIKAVELGAVINFDDAAQIEFAAEVLPKFPELVSFRFNPGPARTGNVIIGDPKEAKYGFTKSQLLEAYKRCRDLGATRFALHTMVISCCIDWKELVETARMCFLLCADIFKETGIKLESINLGGGIGVPYKVDQKPIDLEMVGSEMAKVFDELMQKQGFGDVKIVTECGRYVTGPCGYLVTQITSQKKIYKNYVGVDACMANLMRPGMYEAYHHATPVPVVVPLADVLEKEVETNTKKKAAACACAKEKSEKVEGEKEKPSEEEVAKAEADAEAEKAKLLEEKKAADEAAIKKLITDKGEHGKFMTAMREKNFKPDNAEFIAYAWGNSKAEKYKSTYDIVGGLCENNDKFAVDRPLYDIFSPTPEGNVSALPYEPEVGDYIFIHEAGAHGHSMGFQYNGKLRSAEVLLKPDGTTELIRREETHDDLFACIKDYGYN